MFAQSRSSRVALTDISGCAGLEERKVKSRIADLFRWEVMKNCQLEEDFILLTDHAHKEQAYIHITCKTAAQT